MVLGLKSGLSLCIDFLCIFLVKFCQSCECILLLSSTSVIEESFGYLDAPVERIAGADVPMPYAANLERLAVPQVMIVEYYVFVLNMSTCFGRFVIFILIQKCTFILNGSSDSLDMMVLCDTSIDANLFKVLVQVY